MIAYFIWNSLINTDQVLCELILCLLPYHWPHGLEGVSEVDSQWENSGSKYYICFPRASGFLNLLPDLHLQGKKQKPKNENKTMNDIFRDKRKIIRIFSKYQFCCVDIMHFRSENKQQELSFSTIYDCITWDWLWSLNKWML